MNGSSAWAERDDGFGVPLLEAIHSVLSAPRPIASTTGVDPKRGAQQVPPESADTSPHNHRKKTAPQIAVHLSDRARRRAATLKVQSLNEAQSQQARGALTLDGEASVIARTPQIMSYKQDGSAVYTRDLIRIPRVDFYV